MSEPIHARARKFLQEFFNDEELTTFCFDYFHEVYSNFTQGMTKNQKIVKLVSFCQRRNKLDDLLANLEQERPAQYRIYFVEEPQLVNPSLQPPENIESDPLQTSVENLEEDAEAGYQETILEKPDEKPWSSFVSWYQRLDIVEKIFSIIASIIAIMTFLWAINVIDLPSSRITTTVAPTSAISSAHTTVIPSQIPLPTASVEPSKLPTSTTTPTSTVDVNIPPEDAELGDTWTRPKDGMVMVYVPPPVTPFVLNSGIHVPTKGYWIDKYEVSNAQYQLCVRDGACEPAYYADAYNSNEANYPVVGVSWFDAENYGMWVGGKLPSSNEWEYAAVGDKGTIYAWGDEFDGAKLNFCDTNCTESNRDISWDDGYETTAPINTYPEGASWVGALNMVGNVFEWTASWWDESQEFIEIRGGSWRSGPNWTVVSFRTGLGPNALNPDQGFRIVMSGSTGISTQDVPSRPPQLGDTFIRPSDGMEMLFVPGDTFLMGSDPDLDSSAQDDEFPQRHVFVNSFWIDRTEVTNTQYAAFLNIHGNQVEEGAIWLEVSDLGVLIEFDGSRFVPKAGFANHPVNNVSWYGASAYCELNGSALPTEAQWEYAARGNDGSIYPWGNDVPTCDFAQFRDCDGDTEEVASHNLDSESWVGAMDMAGNVWEWVADWYDEDYYEIGLTNNPDGPFSGLSKVLRGGGWDNHGIPLRSANRFPVRPDEHLITFGFRCVVPHEN